MVARVVTTGCLALALAGCGDAPSDTGAAGGAGGVGETSSATAGPGPVAASATTGAGAGPSTGTGGGNPDDPYGCLLGAAPSRPTSIPEGYRPWACWSQKPQCMLWIPEDPATMVDRLEWGPCATGSPGGEGCRQLERPWWTDGFGIGATFPAVPELDCSGDTPLLRLARESRDDANLGEWWVEWDVYELDGPARFAMRRPYEQGVECGYQDYDLTEGYWVLAAIGQDEEPISDSPSDGAVVIDVEAGTISIPYRDETPLDASWRVGTLGLIRDTGGGIFLHDHGFMTEISLGPGATSAQTMVGETILWEVSTSSTVGIRAYDRDRGPHDLIRYVDDPSRGAGTPGTDGVDLVWTEGSGRQPGDVTYPIRSMVTSPWTTDPAALQPRRLRRDLSTGFGTDTSRFQVGCGRAAKSGGVATRDVQIVNLADGSGWNLVHTPQQWGASRVVGVTCDEIILVVQYWKGGEVQGATLQRIRFDSLGEPIPPD